MKKCLTLLMLSLLSVCLLLVSCGDAGETSSAAVIGSACCFGNGKQQRRQRKACGK